MLGFDGEHTADHPKVSCKTSIEKYIILFLYIFLLTRFFSCWTLNLLSAWNPYFHEFQPHSSLKVPYSFRFFHILEKYVYHIILSLFLFLSVSYYFARLDSLQFAWDNIVNGFHHWFKQWRSEMFIECLILSAIKEHHGISRRFTTNGLELKQYLQKKMIDEDEVPKEIVSVSKALKTWIQSYYFAMSFTPQCLQDI